MEKKKKLNVKNEELKDLTLEKWQENILETKKSKKVKRKTKSFSKELKPYMDFLGITKYRAFEVSYYKGEHKLYIIEADFLETFILKIFNSESYSLKASIEKNFITNAKNISKLTPTINVAHDPEKGLDQFLFTNRMPGANKKWHEATVDEKNLMIKEIARLMFKIHSYNSKRIMKDIIYGKISSPIKTWNEFLKDFIEKKLLIGNFEDKSQKIKFEKYCESKLVSISSHKIEPNLTHGSISLNEQGILRSILFLGTRISGIVNFEDSIFADKIWDLVQINHQILSKNKNLSKTFFNEYGKLNEDEKERLEFYTKLIFE